jgi:hypothetical protein
MVKVGPFPLHLVWKVLAANPSFEEMKHGVILAFGLILVEIVLDIHD